MKKSSYHFTFVHLVPKTQWNNAILKCLSKARSTEMPFQWRGKNFIKWEVLLRRPNALSTFHIFQNEGVSVGWAGYFMIGYYLMYRTLKVITAP